MKLFQFSHSLIISSSPGAPLPPSVHSSLISASEILLQWEEPFSWPGHDILNYTVTVEDNGHTPSVTTNETFYSYTSMSGQVADSCRDILFMVTAFNDVEGAIPRPANHSNGFPIGSILTISYSYSISVSK